jgi:hypothetical protein
MTDRLSNNLIGIAGVHFVVSELSRRGLVALPTVRNIAAYDVLVSNVAGTRHANIQVKTSLKRVTFWPTPAPDSIRAGPRDWYVFVRWLQREDRFEAFMLSGRQTRKEAELPLARKAKRIRRDGKGVFFPCLYVGNYSDGRDRQWSRRWHSWRL